MKHLNCRRILYRYYVDCYIEYFRYFCRIGLDLTDGFGDLDDSAMDVEGPAFMYRYSRRKSDSKSDENSQNSKHKCFAVSYQNDALLK